jgi:hypothetical protein
VVLGSTQSLTETSTRRVRLTTLVSSVSRLSRKCGNLDASQPCEPPRPVTGIALPFTTRRESKYVPLEAASVDCSVVPALPTEYRTIFILQIVALDETYSLFAYLYRYRYVSRLGDTASQIKGNHAEDFIYK